MSGIAQLKSDARAAIHAALALPVLHVNENGTTEGLTARFHTKAKILSAESDGLSIMENIEKVVFAQPELDVLDLALATGDEIHLIEYGFAVVLDQPLDPDGPHNVYWTVTRAA